jgi:hypothetical protein
LGQCFRKARVTLPHYVAHTALPELREDAQPELRAFCGLYPEAQDVLVIIWCDTHDRVDRLILHYTFLANLRHQRVEVHDQVHWLERP